MSFNITYLEGECVREIAEVAFNIEALAELRGEEGLIYVKHSRREDAIALIEKIRLSKADKVRAINMILRGTGSLIGCSTQVSKVYGKTLTSEKLQGILERDAHKAVVLFASHNHQNPIGKRREFMILELPISWLDMCDDTNDDEEPWEEELEL